MFAGALELAVRVGAGGHRTGAPSTVRMADSTIVARGGQSKSNGAGGDGYCGGGGVGGHDGNGWYYGGIGGTNGGKGGQGTITYPRHPHHYQGGAGGRGTGEDITSYTMSEFTVSPGQGGEYNAVHGGGGGGVLVGGWGPARSQPQGEGYGGGGGLGLEGFQTTTAGLAGVVLVEVV